MSKVDPQPESNVQKKPRSKASRPTKKIVKSTPATAVLALAGLPYALHLSYRDADDPASASERVRQLGMDSRRVFETTITQAGDDLVAVSVPVVSSIDLEALASAIGHHHAKPVSPDQAETISGYDPSLISPFGLKQALPSLIDISAMTFPSILVPSGLPGLKIEIAPEDLVNALQARTAPIARF